MKHTRLIILLAFCSVVTTGLLQLHGVTHALVAATQPAVRAAVTQDGVSVYFSPNGDCTDAIIAPINGAQKTIHCQAYSFTSAKIAKAMLEAKKRGVDVVVVLDRSQRTAKYSSATFFNNVGITVLIDDKHAIAHNKIVLIDGKTIITGSFNFTKAAEESNAENLLIIRDKADLYAAYEKNFQEHFQHSVKYQGLVNAGDGKPEPPVGATTLPATQRAAGDGEQKPVAGEELVYVTRSGSHYHRPDCSYLKKHHIDAITLAEAKTRHLAACSRCMPPE